MTEARKKDHLQLSLSSTELVQALKKDERFYYEPLLGKHPQDGIPQIPAGILGYSLAAPIWVSSMTGGCSEAGPINISLAKACAKFRLGMGLGSCRPLLESDQFLADFNLRSVIGEDLPLMANLGIAQIYQALKTNSVSKINNLVSKLSATGLIIHVNPLQEWLQPEGDRFFDSPLEIITEFLQYAKNFPVIVKEVGQGMGPESLLALLKLPIAGIEFAGYGGTNFSQIEINRNSKQNNDSFAWSQMGHSALEMVHFVNEIIKNNPTLKPQNMIISGGVHNFLDGQFLMKKLVCSSIYGQAGQFLRVLHQVGEDGLSDYISTQIRGLFMAEQFLKIKQ